MKNYRQTPMMCVNLSSLAFLSLTLVSSITPADASGLISADNQLRSDLNWLNNHNITAINLATWPLSQEEVMRGLAKAQGREVSGAQDVIQRVQRRMSEIKSPLRINAWTHSVKPAFTSDVLGTHTSASGIGAALELSSENWDINIQGQQEYHQYINDVTRGNLNGSFAGIKFFNQWVAFGEIPQWWGPGNDGSLIRSDAARPVTGFLIQRAEQTPFESSWLSWAGNWQYQVSAGQLRQYQRPEEPKLVGGRLSFTPVSSVEFGFSRIMMWGGKGRPNDIASLRDAFLGRDNTGNQKRDPGNQMAGVDFNLKIYSLTGLPLSIYGQVIGDDQAGILPSHNIFLGGIAGGHQWRDRQINWYFEGADTRSGLQQTGNIYTHYCYQEGYYQQGTSLGDAMGGDGTRFSAKTEVVFENAQRMSAKVMWARVNRNSQTLNHTYPVADTLKGVALGWILPLSSNTIIATEGWHIGHISQHADDTGIALTLTFIMGKD